jgi:alpha-D-ribose 1-methylphosphonate 5-triphosphate synthase subunit PhnG
MPFTKQVRAVDDLSAKIEQQEARAFWMGVLARVSLKELRAALSLAQVELPKVEIVKAAETGTLMLEGRAGGSGRRFNAGEATVTRCVVRCRETLGFSYALGRDKDKAVMAASLDCLLQDSEHYRDLMDRIIQPLADVQRRKRETQSRRAAATKVEFFTMVRGD